MRNTIRHGIGVSLLGISLLAVSLLQASLNASDWLRKGGCDERQSAEVYAMLESAPESVTSAFGIRALADGDYEFAWHRVVMLASR